MSNTDEIKKFFVTQNSQLAQYLCVQISHPDLDTIRLVRDQFTDKTFKVDGVDQVFIGSGFTAPEQSVLLSDDTDKGSLSFERIGYEVVSKLRAIDANPKPIAIEVRIMEFIEGFDTAQSDYTTYAAEISVSARKCSIGLSTQNLAKQTRAEQVYTVDEFEGLRDL